LQRHDHLDSHDNDFERTTIDGIGQNVTISGSDAVRVFLVDSGVTLNLNRPTGHVNPSFSLKGGRK
jgi:hypothetical protein